MVRPAVRPPGTRRARSAAGSGLCPAQKSVRAPPEVTSVFHKGVRGIPEVGRALRKAVVLEPPEVACVSLKGVRVTPEVGCAPRIKRPGALAGAGAAELAGATEGTGRAAGSRRGRGRGRGRGRAPTWEISDSDSDGAAGARAAPRAQGPGEARRAAASAAETLRLLRPEQALRRLTVRVDPAVLEAAGAHLLLDALGALGCSCVVEPQRQARSLRWSRSRPEPCPQGVPPDVWAAEEQDTLLLLLEPEEFVRGVAQITQMYGHSCPLPWLCPESPDRPHLAVIGLHEHLWSCQPSRWETQQQQYPEVATSRLAVGWPEVEEALVLLQLWAGLDVLLVSSWQELAQHVCALTKALAQRPYKQYRESQPFAFCTTGRWTVGERVARDGSGLLGAWRRQITQFNRVSGAVADAVVSAFPSPRLLQQAFAVCSTEEERLRLLADLPVQVDKDTADEGISTRRVGPDLARRIFLFFTTTQPNLLLDLGS